MEIKEGYFVRTKYGDIGQAWKLSMDLTFTIYTGKENLEDIKDYDLMVEVDTNKHFEDEKDRFYLDDIVDTASRLINIIRVGDYVNGKKVKGFNLDTKSYQRISVVFDDNTEVITEEIENILSKEIFEKEKYNVGSLWENDEND